MAKSSRNKQATRVYKEQRNFDDKVLSKAAEQSSQYKSDTYHRLVKDGRLETFLKLLSTAASMGKNREDACRYINSYMGEYFRGEGLCSNTLKMMLERYPDVSEAWTVHRDTIAGAAVNRIAELISKTDNIDILLKVAQMFDNSGIVHDSNKNDYVPTKKTIIVNIDETDENKDSTVKEENEEEQDTIGQLRESVEHWNVTGKDGD